MSTYKVVPPPFIFPKYQSPVLPDPSNFFAPQLLSSPLPTNSFFQNFVLKNGDQPEYIHPYLVKSSSNSLSFCYPSLLGNPSFIFHSFSPDLTISTEQNTKVHTRHLITSYNDLSLTLQLPPDLSFFLVRGSPFLTLMTTNPAKLSISTNHSFIAVSSNSSSTRHTIVLSNNQTWICYSSSPLNLSHSSSNITSSNFSGVARFAILASTIPTYEALLDRFSSCYPISGTATLVGPFCIEYKWETRGTGDLLLLAHPLHLQLLTDDDCHISVLKHFRCHSIDGDLIGVVGEKWLLRAETIPITWHSMEGVNEQSFSEIQEALVQDVDALSPITTNSSYFYGKAIARAARLLLIAEEICFTDVIPAIRKFLIDSITPWLEGTFNGNSFLYDPKWGGLVTRQGSMDSGAEFGFGIYNDHHYHLGYFVYAIAVLAKTDPSWARTYRSQAYALMADYMNLGRREGSIYAKLRCFDLWKLHSWAGGLTEFADGRNQESTSEAINAYYSAALMGLSYGDGHLVGVGATLASFEIHAAQMWWHVKECSTLYGEFGMENRAVGVLWSTKRDSGLWFAPSEWRECRMGIQVLPLLPISEVLFSDLEFVEELVRWTMPSLNRDGVREGWKGLAFALQGIYDQDAALEKTRTLRGFDDGNSLSNLLWWIWSRPPVENEYCDVRSLRHKHTCFMHYCL